MPILGIDLKNQNIQIEILLKVPHEGTFSHISMLSGI